MMWDLDQSKAREQVGNTHHLTLKPGDTSRVVEVIREGLVGLSTWLSVSLWRHGLRGKQNPRGNSRDLLLRATKNFKACA
ncbi:MAG: hypothetical protein LM600_06855 [Thaumarchaeota archaeon]|jgi:hypothetical protein|nr:hypothetical protein [Nitrososphaerota archaeon]